MLLESARNSESICSTFCFADIARRSNDSRTGSSSVASASVKVRSDMTGSSILKPQHKSCASEDVVLTPAGANRGPGIVVAYFAAQAKEGRDLPIEPATKLQKSAVRGRIARHPCLVEVRHADTPSDKRREWQPACEFQFDSRTHEQRRVTGDKRARICAGQQRSGDGD